MKEIEIIQVVLKLTISKIREFLSFAEVFANKMFEIIKLEYSFSCEKLNFNAKHHEFLKNVCKILGSVNYRLKLHVKKQ